MTDASDSDFDSMMRKVGVKRLKPDGSADPSKSGERTRTVRRRAGDTRAAKTASAVSAAPAAADRSAEVDALKRQVATLESELAAERVALEAAKVAVETEKAGRASDADAAKRSLAAVEARYAAYADIAKQVVRSCMNCPSAPGFPAIRVDASECEVCGGESLRTAARKFIDACLINGRLKVCVAGHSPKFQALLRTAAQDRRVTLMQTAVGSEKAKGQAQSDVDKADAVILWCADGLREDILAIYRSAPRVAEITDSTLTAVLKAASEVVGSE